MTDCNVTLVELVIGLLVALFCYLVIAMHYAGQVDKLTEELNDLDSELNAVQGESPEKSGMNRR